MKKFGIKEVVATGIGTALFIVLTEVQIPLGIIPNTSMQPRQSSSCTAGLPEECCSILPAREPQPSR